MDGVSAKTTSYATSVLVIDSNSAVTTEIAFSIDAHVFLTNATATTVSLSQPAASSSQSQSQT